MFSHSFTLKYIFVISKNEKFKFLPFDSQTDNEKVSLHVSVTFTKIALKQTRVKTGDFSQILLFDRCNFCLSPLEPNPRKNDQSIYFHILRQII